ncbi:MAG TPA: polyprenyl synthetase family protein [Phycisphaerae bacterium]|nr:polyprenyl synthetase family protein [Phycisphaerae bacterium]
MTRENPTAGLDLDARYEAVVSWFAPEVLEAVAGPAETETERIARAWLAKGGKRWRPFLAACAFRSFQGRREGEAPEDLRRAAVAVECFHKASLIHDDIEDGDGERYGAKALHAQYGVPIALNAGDFLLGEGYRLLGEIGVADGAKAQMVRAAAWGHRSLCIGQGEELMAKRARRPLAPARVIEIFRMKTAPAFEVALRVGTTLAGAGEDLWPALARYGEALGIAYQIRDDLADWSAGTPRGRQASRPVEPAGDAGAAPGDLEGGRPSILLSLAEERATGETKRFLEAAGRGSLPADGSSGRLARVLADLGIEESARRLLERYRREAVTALGPLPNEGLRNVLERVVGKMFAGEGAFKRGMRNSECGRKEHGERSTADAQPRGAAGAETRRAKLRCSPKALP